MWQNSSVCKECGINKNLVIPVINDLSGKLYSRKIINQLIKAMEGTTLNKFHHADIKGILKDLKQPALKMNLATGIMVSEDIDANAPVLKHFEAEYVERVSKTLPLMFLAALNDIIRGLYPILPKSL